GVSPNRSFDGWLWRDAKAGTRDARAPRRIRFRSTYRTPFKRIHIMNTKSETPRSRLPLVTLALAAFALCIQFLGEPALGILEWRERASVVAEPMRIFTGHLCHWSWNHLAWDLGMFVILGAIVERRG